MKSDSIVTFPPALPLGNVTDCWQCRCLSWMMLHLTFNDTTERGSKLVQTQHFSGFPFKLWQHLLALNKMLVFFSSSITSVSRFMCLRIKEKRIEGVKKRKYSQNLLSNVPYLYEKLLELFCTMSFIYGEVYLRSWSDTVLKFWSIFATQLKMIFCFCIIFCCCSKIQLTGASISIRNASARVKHLVRSDMSRNTATNSVYNKCGMTFVMKRNKNWAHSWNGQTLPRGVTAIYDNLFDYLIFLILFDIIEQKES